MVNEADIKVMDSRIAELQDTIKKRSDECHKMENCKYNSITIV